MSTKSKRIKEIVCKICGKPEKDHHEFEPQMQMPEGCICDPETWSILGLEPICDEYKGDGVQYCQRCDHDRGCHKK